MVVHPWKAVRDGAAGAHQPWRWLWRLSVQMTRTTPLRRMILQWRHIFLIEAETRMGILRGKNDGKKS